MFISVNLSVCNLLFKKNNNNKRWKKQRTFCRPLLSCLCEAECGAEKKKNYKLTIEAWICLSRSRSFGCDCSSRISKWLPGKNSTGCLPAAVVPHRIVGRVKEDGWLAKMICWSETLRGVQVQPLAPTTAVAGNIYSLKQGELWQFTKRTI